ncbi:MAG: uroporphyrinogen decarboxylase family protein [Candidatus Woesearchaeota archaeon]
MDSKSRVFAVLEGNLPDRVPVFPVVDEYHAPKVLGYAAKDCLVDGMKMAESLLAALRLYKYDGIIANLGPGRDPYKQLGCTVDLDSGDVALFTDNLVKSEEDLSKVVPPDLFGTGMLAPVQHILDKVGDTHFVVGSVRAPFEISYIQRGSMAFMSDIYENPGFVCKMINVAKKITLALGDALIESGVHALVVKDSVASASMISPEHYSEFAFPLEQEVISHFRKKVPVILHICRNSEPLLQKMAKTRASVLEIDSLVDLAKAKDLVGNKVVIKGNVDSVEVLERGSTEVIRRSVANCMNAAKAHGNYILSTGDSVPRGCSMDSMKSFVGHGKVLGRYG